MRKLWVKAWMTLDGVFDAEMMEHWWNPFDSAERQQYILEQYESLTLYIFGSVTCSLKQPGQVRAWN